MSEVVASPRAPPRGGPDQTGKRGSGARLLPSRPIGWSSFGVHDSQYPNVVTGDLVDHGVGEATHQPLTDVSSHDAARSREMRRWIECRPRPSPRRAFPSRCFGSRSNAPPPPTRTRRDGETRVPGTTRVVSATRRRPAPPGGPQTRVLRPAWQPLPPRLLRAARQSVHPDSPAAFRPVAHVTPG